MKKSANQRQECRAAIKIAVLDALASETAQTIHEEGLSYFCKVPETQGLDLAGKAPGRLYSPLTSKTPRREFDKLCTDTSVYIARKYRYITSNIARRARAQ